MAQDPDNKRVSSLFYKDVSNLEKFFAHNTNVGSVLVTYRTHVAIPILVNGKPQLKKLQFTVKEYTPNEVSAKAQEIEGLIARFTPNNAEHNTTILNAINSHLNLRQAEDTQGESGLHELEIIQRELQKRYKNLGYSGVRVTAEQHLNVKIMADPLGLAPPPELVGKLGDFNNLENTESWKIYGQVVTQASLLKDKKGKVKGLLINPRVGIVGQQDFDSDLANVTIFTVRHRGKQLKRFGVYNTYPDVGQPHIFVTPEDYTPFIDTLASTHGLGEDDYRQILAKKTPYLSPFSQEAYRKSVETNLQQDIIGQMTNAMGRIEIDEFEKWKDNLRTAVLENQGDIELQRIGGLLDTEVGEFVLKHMFLTDKNSKSTLSTGLQNMWDKEGIKLIARGKTQSLNAYYFEVVKNSTLRPMDDISKAILAHKVGRESLGERQQEDLYFMMKELDPKNMGRAAQLLFQRNTHDFVRLSTGNKSLADSLKHDLVVVRHSDLDLGKKIARIMEGGWYEENGKEVGKFSIEKLHHYDVGLGDVRPYHIKYHKWSDVYDGAWKDEKGEKHIGRGLQKRSDSVELLGGEGRGAVFLPSLTKDKTLSGLESWYDLLGRNFTEDELFVTFLNKRYNIFGDSKLIAAGGPFDPNKLRHNKWLLAKVAEATHKTVDEVTQLAASSEGHPTTEYKFMVQQFIESKNSVFGRASSKFFEKLSEVKGNVALEMPYEVIKGNKGLIPGTKMASFLFEKGYTNPLSHVDEIVKELNGSKISAQWYKPITEEIEGVRYTIGFKGLVVPTQGAVSKRAGKASANIAGGLPLKNLSLLITTLSKEEVEKLGGKLSPNEGLHESEGWLYAFGTGTKKIKKQLAKNGRDWDFGRLWTELGGKHVYVDTQIAKYKNGGKTVDLMMGYGELIHYDENMEIIRKELNKRGLGKLWDAWDAMEEGEEKNKVGLGLFTPLKDKGGNIFIEDYDGFIAPLNDMFRDTENRSGGIEKIKINRKTGQRVMKSNYLTQQAETVRSALIFDNPDLNDLKGEIEIGEAIVEHSKAIATPKRGSKVPGVVVKNVNMAQSVLKSSLDSKAVASARKYGSLSAGIEALSKLKF